MGWGGVSEEDPYEGLSEGRTSAISQPRRGSFKEGVNLYHKAEIIRTAFFILAPE